MKSYLFNLGALLGVVALASFAHGQASSTGRTTTRASSSGAASSAPSGAGVTTTTKRTVTAYDALVTLLEDVKVPATELGMLTSIHATEGQQVDAETLLADIDNRETIAKQLIAQGELDAAVTQAESTAEIEVAEKAIAVAQAELESMEEIRKSNPGAVSLTELRKFRFQLERAQAQLKLAITEQTIARMTVKVKTAQLQAIDIELDRRRMKAPFKGEVVEVYKKRGEWAQAGEPLLHLVRIDKCRVKGFVLATDAAAHEVEGKPVEISVVVGNDKTVILNGTVGYASKVIEGVGGSRQFRIWADVDNRKIIDPVSKKEVWAIQPGSMANMVIDVSPPAAPKPALTPVRSTIPSKAGSTPAGSSSKAGTSSKIEARKPVTKEEKATKTRER